LVLRHGSGAELRLGNDGAVRVQGDLHVSGRVFDSHGPLDQLRDHYNQHVHASLGAPPTQQD
jgi:hypothetical protein